MSHEFAFLEPQSPRKLTFTIRQMMVVVALSALLTALVVNQDWSTCCGERARRSQCVNNLKQLGLAILTYESKHGVLPVGTIPNPDLTLERRLGWNYLVAPELDIHPPFAEGDLAHASDDPALATLRAQNPNMASCPSRLERQSAHYVGIAGLGIDSPTLPATDRRAGVFGDDRVITSADIKDGASTTMMIAETTRQAGPWLAGGRATVRGLDPSRPPYLDAEGQFGSVHRRGANVLMADGSIRFVKESVDPKVFEAMSTIAGGEKVSVPARD